MAKPWDAKLAYYLILPLKNTPITPNHLTTLRLITGVWGALAIAWSNYTDNSFLWCNMGAFLFMFSAFIDHTDGELARLTGKISKWGHTYDLISDGIVLISLFLSIGIATVNTSLGIWSLPMSLIASISVSGIFYLMNDLELKLGKEAARQPNFAGLEAEDILYLFPLVTLFNGLQPFLIAATIGSPIFAIYVIWDYRKSLSNFSNQ
jgi:archaetidylinositol phosphate synthase